MQATEELIRTVVEQVLSQIGPTAHSTNGRELRRPARRLHLRRRGRRRRDRGLRAAQRTDDRRPQADHRPHPPHLDRPVGRAGHDGDGRDQDRPAGAQDREAQDARRADARRRVPAERSVQRRSWPGRDRARSVRRDRRDHAGHAFAADDHRQRGQHDRRRQHAGRQSASQRQARRGRGRAALQPGDLSRPGHRQSDLRHRRADARIGRRDFQPSRREADLRHRRTGRRPGRA